LSRLPGIWFSPNSNDLHIRFSGNGYWDEGFSNIKIPIGITSQILINAVGIKVEVWVNGVVTQFMDLPDTKITGPAILHISDPWYKPANAMISNIKMVPNTKIFPELSMQNALIDSPTQLTSQSMGKVTIPKDYIYIDVKMML
jgi:hypothetical protein